jgi:hypothetical protein
MPVGWYSITVRNTDGSGSTLTNGFQVMNVTPVPSYITPTSGYNNTNGVLNVAGYNFLPGLQVSLQSAGVTIPGIITSYSPYSLVVSFPMKGNGAGKYNLSIINPHSNPGYLVNGFTLLSPGPAPVITGITPAAGFNTGNLQAKISGRYFNGPSVYLRQGGVNIKATPSTITSTQISATVPLLGVPGGMYNLTVSNSDGESSTAYNIFYVTDTNWLNSNRTLISQRNNPLYTPAVISAGQYSDGSPEYGQLVYLSAQ